MDDSMGRQQQSNSKLTGLVSPRSQQDSMQTFVFDEAASHMS